MRTGTFDIETRSAVSLRESGSYIYSIDPSTSPLCLVFIVDDGEPQVWTPDQPPLAIFFEIATNPHDWQLVAHNYEFDRAVYNNILVPQYGYPPLPLEVHHCSQRLALANGYPAELDLLAQALALPYRKNSTARKTMLAVSRPRKRRKGDTGPVFDEDPVKIALVIERCVLDTITTHAVWQSPKLKRLSAVERHYQLQDAIINGRGICCDRAFASAARDIAIRERTALNLKLQELTSGTITSVDQIERFLEAVNARGHAMTTLNRRAVAQVLANKPDDYVRQLLELRRTGARAAARKFERMLAYASPLDARMRSTLRMYWRGSRTLGRTGAAVAKPQEERERPAVERRRSFAPAIATASPNTATRLRCSAIFRAPRCARHPAWNSSRATFPRSRASF